MKIYIGPYKNWFGPYQLAELLCFWVKDVKDKYDLPRKPDWVHNFGEWLAHGSVLPEPTRDNPRSLIRDEDRPTTWLYRLLLWIDKHRKRRIYIKIDNYDTWGMDSTLSMIILPMLKQLQATKHGSPFVDDEDVPDELKSTSALPKENEWDTDSNHHLRWDWVMNEMIWAFEQLNTDWEAQYHTGNYDLRSVACEWDENGKPKMYPMEDGPNHTAQFDQEGHKKHNERIQRGLILFGKYYRGLWD